LYFASKDTNVYKIDMATGKLIWNYRCGGMLDKAPQVTADLAYQVIMGRGLAAIDKTSGKLVWQLAGGESLLSEAQGRAYVMTHKRELAVMDNKTGKQLYSVNFSAVTRYVPNVVDSKIYIGDNCGKIECLKPVK
jgi:eukaryotic-like serine/threonine-protein kinase